MKTSIFPLIVALLLFFVPNLMADVFNRPEFVHAVRKYYQIVDDAKRSYANALQKELDFAQKQGNVPYYNEIEAELKHTRSENGYIVTEYMPKTKALFSAKLRLKQTVDRTQTSFKGFVAALASELLKIGRVDEAKSVQNLADLSEPPRHLGQPGKRIPEPATARGKQLLRNMLANNAPPPPNVDIPKENPFAFAALKLKALQDDFGYVPPNLTLEEIERFRAVRKKSLNIPTAKLKTELSSHRGSACAFGRFTPDSKNFVAMSWSEMGCNVFDTATGKPIVKLSYPHALARTDIHPNGKIVATGTTGTADGKILLWNIADGSIIKEISAHQGFIDGMRFSPDGSFLASGSQDKTAAIWDTKTGKELMRCNGKNNPFD